jgi:hypothetical protein
MDTMAFPTNIQSKLLHVINADFSELKKIWNNKIDQDIKNQTPFIHPIAKELGFWMYLGLCIKKESKLSKEEFGVYHSMVVEKMNQNEALMNALQGEEEKRCQAHHYSIMKWIIEVFKIKAPQ